MKNRVILKSFLGGISVIMDGDIDFEELLSEVAKKFRESDNFFKDAAVAISLEGRQLDSDQERRVLDAITENSHITVLCLMEKDKDKNMRFVGIQNNLKFQDDENCGQFFRGSLTDSQSIETDKSIIILGDVEEGCSVYSTKDIVILGRLGGEAYAGTGGNANHFVVALDMNPTSLQIADYIYEPKKTQEKPASKWGFGKKKAEVLAPVPKIAYTYHDEILVEPISKEVLESFTI